jgi:hypothetical protein
MNSLLYSRNNYAVYFSSISIYNLVMDHFKGGSGTEYFTIGTDSEVNNFIQMQLLPGISSDCFVYMTSDNKIMDIFYFYCLIRNMKVVLI